MNAPWIRGTPLHLASSRLELTTLSLADLDALTESENPEWYGDEARRRHLWAPPLKTLDYFRGLVRATDQKSRFAFLIRVGGEPIGFLKVQLTKKGDGVQLVPSIVIGDESQAGLGLGSEATGLFIWFAIENLEVTEVCLRFYDDNLVTERIAKRYGYSLLGADPEVQPDGSTRRVLSYGITSEAWLERNRPEAESFRFIPQPA